MHREPYDCTQPCSVTTKGRPSGAVAGSEAAELVSVAALLDVRHEAALYRREAFGPVACIEFFEAFDDALARVNDSDFGLQAAVFTARLDHAMRAWERLEVGGVVIGDVPSFRVDNMPYGGVKHSGLGREGVRWAIADMTEERLLVIKTLFQLRAAKTPERRAFDA